MATITSGYTFVNNETVTPSKLNALAGSATISGITDADIANTAAIANSKLAGSPATAATANTIALRDASGNLTATTFLGNVTGNVTGTATGLATPVQRGLAKAWVGFTAPGALTTVTVSGTTTAISATKTNHNLNTGDCITIFGATGNNAVLNGTWVITRTDANNFTFTITTAPGSAISGVSITVYPIQIFASYNIATVAPASTTSAGVYDVTFASGVTFPTYTTYSGSTPTTAPAYWVSGNVENPDASGAFPIAIRVSSDQKTATKFRVRAWYLASGSSTITLGDFAAVFLAAYSL